jgi:hypothetical protein
MLSRNHLNSSIPREIFELSFSYLDLSYNSLSGPLPSEVGSLVNLNELDLSGNNYLGRYQKVSGSAACFKYFGWTITYLMEAYPSI